jgi:hypothetical protein
VKKMTDEEWRRFAAERSHKDSEISNEHSRATAQACILINGGAATAVLAFLTKDKIDPAIFSSVPWCLVGYAVGVFFGAFMMFCATQSMDYWHQHWEAIAQGKPRAAKGDNAEWWWTGFYRCFAATMACFLGASIFLAWILFKNGIASPLGIAP